MEREEVLVNWLNEEEGEEIALDDVTNDYGYDYVTPVGDYLVLTEDEAYEAVKDEQLVKEGHVDIDYSALANWLINNDGYGNSLSPYDGRTNEYSDEDGDYLLIFRTN